MSPALRVCPDLQRARAHSVRPQPPPGADSGDKQGLKELRPEGVCQGGAREGLPEKPGMPLRQEGMPGRQTKEDCDKREPNSLRPRNGESALQPLERNSRKVECLGGNNALDRMRRKLEA
ncbi:hypothetical protein NDU88_006279 [Pleurodeles waltl]|uniref:Uncharacterized protein n=1 Tax=Pleurodeles waltl TaxID=8319 RepID=A0AAV7LQ31_PLEWA|nr:hypothetical protein NDU88_006279 [Pleurodeles waltl]